jgi:hypothetical protein
VAVASRRCCRLAVRRIAQTALLAGLNSAGIYFSRQRIPDPAGMLVKNAAFLVLAWVTAGVAAGATAA